MATVFVPGLLAVHGWWVLAFAGGAPWQWLAVSAVGVGGVAVAVVSLFHGDLPGWVSSLEAGLLGILAMVLIVTTGGTASFFLLWFFAIVALYPAVVGRGLGAALAVLPATAYATLPLWQVSRLPAPVVWSRAALLAGIGVIGVTMAGMRRRARHVQARFERLVEAAGDAIVLVDRRQRILLMNARAEQLFGYDREELIGGPLDVLLPARFRASHGDLCRGFIDGDEPSRLMDRRPEPFGRRKDGSEFPVEVVLSQLDGADGAQVVAVVRDVSPRKEWERMLRERQAELEELVRSKDELIASVSHEIRTPLTALVGFAQLLGEEGGLTEEERREMIHAMVRQGTDLANIVDDLVVAARAETGSLVVVRTEVDLRVQAEQVLEELAPRRREAPRLTGGPARCWGDPARVRQVIRNLVENALRYGGEQVRIETGIEGDHAYVRVVDDGPGVDAADRELIFQPYRRAHATPGQPEALGLGLHISRRLAGLMEGRLVYRREDGESVFELTLPVAADATAET